MNTTADRRPPAIGGTPAARMPFENVFHTEAFCLQQRPVQVAASVFQGQAEHHATGVQGRQRRPLTREVRQGDQTIRPRRYIPRLGAQLAEVESPATQVAQPPVSEPLVAMPATWL